MTEVILPHVTTKVCFRSSEKTKLPFSRRRNSCCDAENDENFPETPAGAFVEKLHKTIILWEHLYRHTSDIFFHLFYDHCREYLKPFANFGISFGDSFLRILGNSARFFLKLRVKLHNFISPTHHSIIKWQKLRISFTAAQKYEICFERWKGCRPQPPPSICLWVKFLMN